MLAERHGLPTETAFSAMSGHARRSGQPLTVIASEIISGSLDTAELTRGNLRP